MGKIGQGILGGISGKVGNVVGGTWKGIDYLRIKPTNVANPRSEGQVNQRNKFTIAIEYLQPNKEFVKLGYKAYATKKTEFNAAMSYVLNNAVGGVAPDFTVDYATALLSRGSLNGALNPTTDVSVSGAVTFNWNDNSDEGNSNETDKVMVLVYNPSRKESMYVLKGAERTVGTQTVTIPGTYTGETLELFIAFISEEGKVSNSQYLGSEIAS